MFNISGNLKTLLRVLAYSVPVGIAVVDVVGYVARVDGHSMRPVLNPQNSSSLDFVFLHSWPIATNSFDEISRGDIVSLISPKDPRQRLIKRVIGLGGDTVETDGYSKPFVTIPQGHCWVEGDYRGNSLDSNNFGPIAVGLIKSKARCIVWPPSRWQLLNKDSAKDRSSLNLTIRVKDHNQNSIIEDDTSDSYNRKSVGKLL